MVGKSSRRGVSAMSASTKSTSESESSPPTGDATDDAPDDAKKSPPVSRAQKPKVEVEFEVSRQRTATWTVFGLVVGALCIMKLGTVGVWAGVALMVVGAYRGFQLAQTFLNPPGTIVVRENTITLPRGLCASKPLEVARKDVTAVYMLRRSVPWHRAAPVLVVELGPKAMIYPRDWFATEADQREVVNEMNRAKFEIAAPASDA